MENAVVAAALGLKVGAHKVKDVLESDSSIIHSRIKPLVSNQGTEVDTTNKSVLKRTVEVVSPEVSPAKKPKIIIAPAKTKQLPAIEQLVMTNAAANKLTEASKPVSQNAKAASSNVRIISYSDPKVSGTKVSGKNVSLLPNTLPSKFTAHPSLSNFTSATQPVNNSSQKVIILSGKGAANADPVVPISASTKLLKNTLRTSEGNSFIPVNQLGTQFIAISNAQNTVTQNKVLIQDSVTGQYSMAEISNTMQQNVPPSANQVSQPVFIKLPQGPVNSQYLQPKLVLSEASMLNPVSNGSNEQAISVAMGDQGGELTNILYTSNQQIDSANTASSMGNICSQNVLLTYQNSESQSLNQDIPSDVVYTFANDSDSSGQENVVFVNPESMFLNEQDSDKLNGSILSEEEGCTQVLLSNNEEELNVINSVSDGAVNISTEVTNDESVIGGDNPVTDDQFDTVGNISAIQENDVNMAAINKKEPVNSYATGVGPETDQDVQNVQGGMDRTASMSLESLQIPGSSIFQTEDGIILIQNPDGTTLQLQGPDGQAVALETVQALLGMDAETQFVTEVSQ